MAKIKNYGLEGVSHKVQLGKQGPHVASDETKNKVVFTNSDGTTLASVQGANATTSNEFVTKAQLDVAAKAESTFTATITPASPNEVVLGTIPAGAKTVTSTITIDTEFDGSTGMRIGIDADDNLLFHTSKNDPGSAGSYQSISTAQFLADTEVKVYSVFVSVTTGSATITVSYY
jgi:hypothetical protein